MVGGDVMGVVWVGGGGEVISVNRRKRKWKS